MRWDRDGLRFECTLCGNCCSGQPGHVWLTLADEEEIAKYLRLPAKKLRRRYTRLVGTKLSLIERPNGDCVFLTDDRRCAIHPVKPRQCITYPFWRNAVATRENWERATRNCPGTGIGPLYTADEIDELTDETTPIEVIWKLLSKGHG